jgi:glyoxylase I family protein
MIEDFQHVCITCRDLETSVRFYERLGLEVIEPVSELNEEAIARAFQTSTGHVKVLHLAPPGAPSKMFIDLVQWLEPASTGEAYPAANHIGINHLAFRVSDVKATTTALRERAASVFSVRNRNVSDLCEPSSPPIPMECSFNSSNGSRGKRLPDGASCYTCS